MSDMILVHLRLFANARDIIGMSAVDMEVPVGTDIETLKNLILEKYQIPEKKFSGLIFSRNHVFVERSTVLSEGDEIGVFPPVSGGSENLPTITEITSAPLNLNELCAQITSTRTGAAAIFTGFVRGETPGSAHPTTERLEYEAYQEMAVKMMESICTEIREKWNEVFGIFMVQRVGELMPGDIAVAIGVTTGHRGDGCFEAARYGIDRLKEVVPVWKKEISPDGEEWIEGSYLPTGSN